MQPLAGLVAETPRVFGGSYRERFARRVLPPLTLPPKTELDGETEIELDLGQSVGSALPANRGRWPGERQDRTQRC